MLHESKTVRGEGGQAMVELGGVLVVVALVIAAVAGTGLAQQVSGGITRSVAAVLGGRSATAAGAGPASPAGGPGRAGSPGGAGGSGGSGGSGGASGGSLGASGGSSPSGRPASAVGGAGQSGGAGDGAGGRGPQSTRLPAGGQRPYVPPKGAHGKPQRVRGGGFKDAYGNVWKWDPSGHAGPHWDVEHPDGSHTNVAPDGTVIGKDNFPNKAPQGSGRNSGGDGSGTGDTVKKAAGGAAILGTLGTILWWAGKAASPACGPLAPVCAIVG